MPGQPFYLLKYIDEADYRCYDRLFSTEELAMKAGINTCSEERVDEEIERLANATLEEKLNIFKTEGVYPQENENSNGCYYFRVEEITLEE